MEPEILTEAPLTEEETTENFHRYLEAGRRLASPGPGEEVVITGIAGRFADADDVYKFRDNLFGQISMVSKDNRRWKSTHPEVPHPSGKINGLEKFDAGFFDIHYRQAQHMDPAARQLLERAYEAVMDAGFHPEQLRGTRTGVYIGATYSETEKTWWFDKLESPTFAATGVNRSTLAHWISYCMGLQGRSSIISTACSTSVQVINDAYIDIRSGKCESALVGATNLCLHPMTSLALYRLGILCLDGQCKSFDERANGYVRSEGIAVIFLQKASNARRIYSQIYHVKTNCDGYKQQGIQQPSPIMQKELVTEVYQECNITPQDLDYFEAHATGTHVGDYIETASIDEAICSRRKSPLYVGSTKSVLGHTEATSGISAIVKMIIGMEQDCFLPNNNYEYPRKELKGIHEGRMVVVTKVTPWPTGGTGLTAVNSFGFGGTNGHVVLKRFWKRKVNNGEAVDDLPRLVCVSGRSKESVAYLLEDVAKRNLDVEFVRLLHEVFRDNIVGHSYRGYSIVSKKGEIDRSLQCFVGQRRPLCLVFGHLGKNWLKIGTDLLTIPLFQSAMEKIDNILSTKGINITVILQQKSPANAFNEFVGTVAVQIALIDILKTLEIVGNYIVGFSAGELAAAYADGALTLKQTILLAYCNVEVRAKEIKNKSTLQCTYSKQIRSKLLQQLQKLIPKPKQWSVKWITTSQVRGLSKFASAEYFVDTLLRPSTNQGTMPMLPTYPTILKIGSVLAHPRNSTIVDLVATENDNNAENNYLLHGLGRLYQLGYHPKLEKLYPTMKWPVSVGTPMISPLIKWDHTDNWHVPRYEMQEKLEYGKRIVTFNIDEPEWTFMTGHVLDGHNIVPAMGYLYLVWETLAMTMDALMSDMEVVFENVKFHRATNIPKNGHVKLTITVHKLTGRFEIEELEESIVTGEIYVPEDISDVIPDTCTALGLSSEAVLMNEDIYKELKLRGYDYTGAFGALKTCDAIVSKGLLEWKGNWITFVDNMLQMQLLQKNTRNLYVPIGIEQLRINAPSHVQYAKDLVQDSVVPVYFYKDSGVIRSGAIQIRGMTTNSMPRSKSLEEPLLKTYKFIPHQIELSMQQSIRITSQILLENISSLQVRVVEVVDAAISKCSSPIGPAIYQVVKDHPLVQLEIVILSKDSLKVADACVENRLLNTEIATCHLVVVSHGLSTPKVIKDSILALKEGGFILSREDKNLRLESVMESVLGLNIMSVHKTETEKLILLRRIRNIEEKTIVDISGNADVSEKLSKSQEAAKNGQKVIILSQNQPLSGILGLVQCLKYDQECSNIQFFFIIDQAPKFDIHNEFYSKQIQKGLAINVFNYGKWGTYRNLLLLENAPSVQCEHIFTNITVRGDLSSLRWIEGPLTSKHNFMPEDVQVYCASINSRDVMLATGRISGDVVARDCPEQYNLLGIEFSGRDATGRRVMGLVNNGALASMVAVDSYLTWKVPREWSLEEAATVPAAYVTAMYGLIIVSQIKPNQSILIHAGASDTGQAAINVALHYKCKVFTTVATEEERKFIKKHFHQIPENHIGNSHNTSFEQMVLGETYGRGINVVFNSLSGSLSGETLQASVRCLAPGGKFLHIVKADSANNNTNRLQMSVKIHSFHGISLDGLIDGHHAIKQSIQDLIIDGLKRNCIKPLKRTIFKKEEVEQAFRYMAAHNHMGKVIINIREEESQKVTIPKTMFFRGLSRFYCNDKQCYVIVGKLADFGLELIDWLVRRGAKNVLLVSGQEMEPGYQALRIRTWKSYGVTIDVLAINTTTKEACEKVINKAIKLGPVAGIFNLEFTTYVDVKNQGNWDEKVVSTKYLNIVSREKCPLLQHFVVFLSTPNGCHQANYALATSSIERIFEERKRDGYPALAIRWGAIEVINSLPENQDTQIGQPSNGILPQKIPSCLNVMDTFLKQDEPVVSSIVLAKKKDEQTESYSTIDVIKKIIGLKDLKTISTHTTLSELGMDSIVAVEVKQILDKEFHLAFTAHDVRNMSFERLQELSDAKQAGKGK